MPSSYNIPSDVWASIFPTGAAGLSNGGPVGTFSDGEYTSPPASASTSLSPVQASLLGLGYDTSISIHSAVTTLGSNPSQSVNMTTGSFAAILSSNMTAYITTLNAMTYNFSASAAPTDYAGSNGTLSGSPTLTTASNGTVLTGSPIPMQTVNVSPAVPVSLFSLLVAISAVAFAL
jgi:hypothetical protein